MKKYFVISLLGLSILLIPSITNIHAQLAEVPNIHVSNIQLQKTDLKAGETVTGTFEASTVTAASDIYFTISLVGDYQKNTLADAFYDSITISSSYNLKAGETKTIPFSYIIPQVKTGTGYGIQIGGLTHAGINLGWSDALIKITNDSKIQYLDIVNAELIVDGKTFGLQEGPMVPSTKIPTLDLTISNPTSQSVTITPSIDLYNRVVLGTPLSTVTANPITIPAKGKKQVSIPLPTNNYVPLVYVSQVSFLDSNNTERLTAIDVRYIVQGDIATIHTVTTDKKSFNKNEVVAVTLGFSGTPLDIVANNNPIKAVYDTTINLLNDKNQSVATWSGTIDYNAAGTKTVSLTTTASANGYTIDVTVSKSGKTITHYSTKVAGESNPLIPSTPITTNWWYLIGGALLVGIIVIALIVLMRRNRKVGSVMFFLLLLVGTSFVSLNYSELKKAEAGQWWMTPSRVYYNVYNLGLGLWSNSPRKGDYFTPNQSFYATGGVVAYSCSNSGLDSEGKISIFNSSGTKVSETAYYDMGSFSVSGGRHRARQVFPQYSIPVSAPSTPGTYKMYINVKTYWRWGETRANIFSGDWVQDIVVVSPLSIVSGGGTLVCKAASNTIKWSSVPGAQRYSLHVDDTTTGVWTEDTQVDCSTSGMSEGDVCLSDISGTSYSVPVIADHSYVARVYSFDGEIWSEPSNTISFNAPISENCGEPDLSSNECKGNLPANATKCTLDEPSNDSTSWAFASPCPGGSTNICKFTCSGNTKLEGGNCVIIEGTASCRPQVADSSSNTGFRDITFANVGQLVTWVALDEVVLNQRSWRESLNGPVLGAEKSYPIRYSTIGNKTMSLTVTPWEVNAVPFAVPCKINVNGVELDYLPIINDPNFHEF
jgi:hypothetical protein